MIDRHSRVALQAAPSVALLRHATLASEPSDGTYLSLFEFSDKTS